MLEKNNFPIQHADSLETCFPVYLRSLTRPVARLYWRGDLSATCPRIAIVGTRKASPEGKKMAYHIAYTLARAGWCVVSGLAFGIDAAAHQGALAAGGITWAVLAHGLDTIQPKNNTALAHTILNQNGCLISEYPAGTPPLPHRFLERNRIVSGLCEAVIVIEAPRASGSLATAHHAREQHKPVFVFPGPATSPLYAGSHELIRQGARLVRNSDDILQDLAPYTTQTTLPSIQKHQSTASLQPLEEKILAHLRAHKKTLSIDTLIDELGIAYHEIQPALASLCSTQHIKEIGPQQYEA